MKIKLTFKVLLIAFVWFATSCNEDTDGACSDGIQNQGETGVDCGGPCEPCNGSAYYYFDGKFNDRPILIDAHFQFNSAADIEFSNITFALDDCRGTSFAFNNESEREVLEVTFRFLLLDEQEHDYCSYIKDSLIDIGNYNYLPNYNACINNNVDIYYQEYDASDFPTASYFSGNTDNTSSRFEIIDVSNKTITDSDFGSSATLKEFTANVNCLLRATRPDSTIAMVGELRGVISLCD